MTLDHLPHAQEGDRIRVTVRRGEGQEKAEVFYVQDVRENEAAVVLMPTTGSIGVEDPWELDLYPDHDFGKPVMRRGSHRQRIVGAELL